MKTRTGKIILAGALVILAGVMIAGVMNFDRLLRLYRVIHLFDEDQIVQNFQNMGAIFDSRKMEKSGSPFIFKRNMGELPEEYLFQGEKKKIREWLKKVETTGLLVLRDDTILFEKYYLGHSESKQHISWSVAKSFISALLGIAHHEGYIDSIEDPVTKYLPYLTGTGYDNVSIKDVLQMSSGVRFNEDYGDFHSDINRMGRVFALNTPMDEFVATLEREKEPGTWHHYVSMDTQVLGMIIRKTTGKTISEYMKEKLWEPLGMESDAFWLIDGKGMEAVFGGLNATLRDYARFGRLYLHQGRWQGKQIVPEKWVKSSITPDGPHLKPGKNPMSTSPMGYGYQWWIPMNPDGDFMAIGIYGQAIYIYPKYGIIIARNGAYADYNQEGGRMEVESVEVYRAIARKMGSGK